MIVCSCNVLTDQALPPWNHGRGDCLRLRGNLRLLPRWPAPHLTPLSALAAYFRWMVDVSASVTGSLQFAKLCSIYLTPCSGGL
jgi:hypothetical protein